MDRRTFNFTVLGGIAGQLLGCDSNKDQTGSKASAAQTQAPVNVVRPANPGVTADQIVIGQSAAFSGPSVALGIEMWRGVFAAFEVANSAGGVHGRRIKLALADDGYEAERAAPALLKLVEQDNVFCTGWSVGTPTLVKSLPVVLQYHLAEKLFHFGNFTGAQPQRTPPYDKAVFNIRASYRQEVKAAVDAFVRLGRRKIATFVQDDAYGTDGREGTVLALKDHGLEPVADTRYPRGQKYEESTKAQVDIMRQSGADALVMVGSYQACAGLVREARSSGWDVPAHNVSFVGPDQLLELLKTEEQQSGKKLITNLINTQVVPHYTDNKLPMVAEYRAAMDRVNPQLPEEFKGSVKYNPPAQYSFGSLESYITARVFLKILEATGPELDRTRFMQTAEGMGSIDIGLGVPAEFSPTRHQLLDTVWFTYATNTGWHTTTDIASVIRA